MSVERINEIVTEGSGSESLHIEIPDVSEECFLAWVQEIAETVYATNDDVPELMFALKKDAIQAVVKNSIASLLELERQRRRSAEARVSSTSASKIKS